MVDANGNVDALIAYVRGDLKFCELGNLGKSKCGERLGVLSRSRIDCGVDKSVSSLRQVEVAQQFHNILMGSENSSPLISSVLLNARSLLTD